MAESSGKTGSSFFQSVNWGANKKRQNTAQEKNILSEDHEDKDDEAAVKKFKVVHIENGKAIGDGTEEAPKKKEAVVIPRVVEEDWRVKRLREKEAAGTLTDEDRARLAILLEASGEEEGTKTKEIHVVKSDDVPEDPDYSAVNIADFGMAILRGYGFKEEEGIGKTNKKSVVLSKPVRRKNVGVGAKAVENKVNYANADPEEDLKTLKVGSRILVEQGKLTGKYGIVESLDPDNSACYVKLAIPGNTKGLIKVSEFNLRIVPKKEYEAKAKVLNSREYDEAKKSIEKQQSSRENGNSQKSKSGRKSSESESEPEHPSNIWAVEDLRVRVIDKKYKNGKYYKEKMVVVNASSPKTVTLTDEYKKLHEIKRSAIETVIPRGLRGVVMILKGEYRGEIGEIAGREKDTEVLFIRLFNADDLVCVESYDDACEYVGYVRGFGQSIE